MFKGRRIFSDIVQLFYVRLEFFINKNVDEIIMICENVYGVKRIDWFEEEIV